MENPLINERRNLPCEYISVAKEFERAPTPTPSPNTGRGRRIEPIATPTLPYIPPAPSISTSTRGRGGGGGGEFYFDAGFEQIQPTGLIVPQQAQQQFSAYGQGQSFGYENDYPYASANRPSEWTTPYDQHQQQYRPQPQHQTYPMPSPDSMYLNAQHPNHSYTPRMETNMYSQ
ncbi:hypothetical protein FB45DRAFT_871831 [Roridomyces roridus]|uniref:Uncharacterized protein n=1 Tax=Roridomyces roridus TaxID=1738132 RepID=A0AAD7BFW6_9AGAR|nr:hypothetical protein FB45DRAFT_871831 [Roridomyces roridus]